MQKTAKSKKQQAAVDIVSSMIGIIFTIVFILGWLYILSCIDNSVAYEPVANPLESPYAIYLVLKWSVILVGAVVILTCIYRLIKAIFILSHKDNHAEHGLNNYYADDGSEKEYKETITFTSREMKYNSQLDMILNKISGKYVYYVTGITDSNYTIETTVDEYTYYRWIKGLVADVTFLYKRDADDGQLFFIREINILNNPEIPAQVIHNYLEDEKSRLNEYIQKSEKSIASKLTDHSRDFATSHINAFKVIDCINTPDGMEVYLSTIGRKNLEPVGYPYFKYKTTEYTKYKTDDIVKIDMKKIIRLDLHTLDPQRWFYDISYLNEEDIEKGTILVNTVNQYL